MHYARSDGIRVEARDLTLRAARGKDFICDDCRVSVDVVAMPGLEKASDWNRSRPGFSELYFRVSKPWKHGACPFAPKYVEAVIEEVVIASRMGAPGAPPAAIRLAPPARIGPIEPTATAADDAPRHRRHVDRWGELRERGDRATVVPGIEPACRAYLQIPGVRRRALRVDLLPHAHTYDQVFAWLPDRQEPEKRIWVGTPRFQQMPVYGQRILSLELFDGRIVIDREDWGRERIARFDVDLEIALTWMRDRRGAGDRGWQPRCFVFGQCSDAGEVGVADPRAFCMLIHLDGGDVLSVRRR